MPRFFTMFEMNLFKISAVSDSDLALSSFYIKFILFPEIDLSEIKGFMVFQNCLLSITFFHLTFRNVSF